ncbi:FAD-dependent oxidoreductase [Microbacterium sp. 18062]|uniref:FAD-dependent oxidoreductase n=1 Tax=Microbacterium sp. 18062 TaxID=2681410 RepID=UPI00190F7FF3|nr:FAD-dependent oxidoreductase [Microbacterium sp. 18062]
MSTSIDRRDVVVIGGGVMGSAAAWQLARRGIDVLLVERFPSGTSPGASFGGRRNLNLGYWDDTSLDLLAQALPLWERVEEESGLRVMHRTDIVIHGDELPGVVADMIRHHGFTVEESLSEESAERGPWFGFGFGTRRARAT